MVLISSLSWLVGFFWDFYGLSMVNVDLTSTDLSMLVIITVIILRLTSVPRVMINFQESGQKDIWVSISNHLLYSQWVAKVV